MVCHVFISGYVQGIGFRVFVKKHASDLGLNGWVTNTQDGRVEAVFEGEKDKIEEMLAFCRKGPFLAQVRDVDVNFEEQEKKHYQTFEIVR